jgi:hypothetical protein
VTGEVFIGGHSLGAARAYLYAFSRIMRGLRVDGIYTLAPPKPGDKFIGATLAGKVLMRALHNFPDPVPESPFDVEELDFDYDQPYSLTRIRELPSGIGALIPTKYHAIGLYQAGAHKLPPIAAPVTLAEAADQIARLYADATGWDWINPVDGAFASMKVMPSGARLVVFRGTQTELEWLSDFDFIQDNVLGARVSRGFWSGVGALEKELDAALA